MALYGLALLEVLSLLCVYCLLGECSGGCYLWNYKNRINLINGWPFTDNRRGHISPHLTVDFLKEHSLPLELHSCAQQRSSNLPCRNLTLLNLISRKLFISILKLTLWFFFWGYQCLWQPNKAPALALFRGCLLCCYGLL